MSQPRGASTLLDQARRLGMFFAIADARADPGAWSSSSRLYVPASRDLDELIEETQSRLGGCEPRVAASILFQGYAARLLSPQIALTAWSSRLEFSARTVVWRRPSDQVIELGLVEHEWFPQQPPTTLLPGVIADMFVHHLDPLAEALRGRVSLAGSVLVGNVASAIVAACRLLPRSVDLNWVDLADAALKSPRLHGAGQFDQRLRAFWRTSCCLYYRVQGGGLCGDCPIRRYGPSSRGLGG